MSFSTGFKNRNANPCQAWIQLGKMTNEDGSKTELPVFHRWDKETKQNVTCDLTQGFIVLDPDIMKIVGFNRKINKNVMSNEVRSIHDKLTIISYMDDNSKKVWFEGSYKELKDSMLMEGIGAKYANSIYIGIRPELVGLEDDSPLILASIQASGACCDAWMTFCNKIKPSVFSSKLVVHDNSLWTPKQNGDVHYQVPTFSLGGDIDKDIAGAAIEQDLILQEYLKEYFKTGEVAHDPSTSQGEAPDAPDQSEDFDQDGKPMALQFKLKNNKLLGDCTLAEVKEMADYLHEKKVDPKTNKTCANVLSVLKYLKQLEAEKEQKAKAAKDKPASIASFLPTEEEDDDIPF